MRWASTADSTAVFHFLSVPSVFPLICVLPEMEMQLCGLEVMTGVVENDANEGSECNSITFAE